MYGYLHKKDIELLGDDDLNADKKCPICFVDFGDGEKMLC